MKKPILFALAAIALAAAADYVYSPDNGATVRGVRKSCPTQGVNLETGDVVVGLDVRPYLEQAACGYWHVVEGTRPAPVSNETYRVTGYQFSTVAGEATPLWEAVAPRHPVVKKYSKLSIIEALESLGKWQDAKAAIDAAGLMDKWNAATWIAADNPAFIAAKPQIAAMLGIDEAALDELLENCLY